jgi:hypothetical protein
MSLCFTDCNFGHITLFRSALLKEPSLFVGHAAQKSKLHNLQYDEGGNHMAETETETY